MQRLNRMFVGQQEGLADKTIGSENRDCGCQVGQGAQLAEHAIVEQMIGNGKVSGMGRVVHALHADVALHRLVGVQRGRYEHRQEYCQQQARHHHSASFRSHYYINPLQPPRGEAFVLPAPQGEGLGVGSVISLIILKLSINRLLFLNTDPTPCPSPTMGGEYEGPLR